MAEPSLSRPVSGALLALAGWAAFSLQDAVVKALVVRLPVPEVLFGRSLGIVLISLAFVRARDYRACAERRNAIGILVRAALILVAWLAYYRASRDLQLADLVTYYFVAPLFVVGLAAPLLGEAAGVGRWLAVAVGFSGVLVAANPTGGAPLAPVALCLVAAFAWALTTLLSRSLSKGVSTPAMMLASSAVYAGACGAALPVYGVAPSLPEAASIAGLGVIGAIGQFLWFEGVRRAQASLLAPLEYSLLPYAIVWGYVFFGDLPGLRTLIGAAIILSSGLAAMGIELRRRRIAPQREGLGSRQ